MSVHERAKTGGWRQRAGAFCVWLCLAGLGAAPATTRAGDDDGRAREEREDDDGATCEDRDDDACGDAGRPGPDGGANGLPRPDGKDILGCQAGRGFAEPSGAVLWGLFLVAVAGRHGRRQPGRAAQGRVGTRSSKAG